MPDNHLIDSGIFRAYDIRGIYPKSLSEKDSYAIGQAAAEQLIKIRINNDYGVNQGIHQNGSAHIKAFPGKIIVACDSRLSSPGLKKALTEGILSSGIDVIDIGQATTPMLYFAAIHWWIYSGIMVTGSHNPADYNGFKLVLAGETLANASIQALYQRILARKVLTESGPIKGQLTHKKIDTDYLDAITNDIKLQRKLKVVIDAGNGIAGPITKALLTRLGCDLVDLYCEPDGHFPNHHPDPGKPENLRELMHTVTAQKADIGLAFDGDGDRLGVVTDQGDMVFPDYLLMLFAQYLLKDHPGSHIIFDVKCTHLLAQQISAWGGKPEFYQTGHSLIKKHMKQTGAALAGEMSGHLFFADRWYGFDDGLYSAARLLEILSGSKKTISQLLAHLPKLISTPEINIRVTESEKFTLVKQLAEDSVLSQAGETIKIDGIRVNMDTGWGLVRASNTTPTLVLRFEAVNAGELKRIKQLFKDALLRVKDDLDLSF